MSASRTSSFESIAEVLDLGAGAVVVGMPFLLLAIPGLILFVVLPGLLLAVPALVVGLLLSPVFLVRRIVHRR